MFRPYRPLPTVYKTIARLLYTVDNINQLLLMNSDTYMLIKINLLVVQLSKEHFMISQFV